ncbi:MAG: helix-turn-helix transcriptional regulator [Bacteroidota bacterium]
MKTLGEILRESREVMPLTLRQVEEATGISNAYLSQVENGKIKKPSINVLYKLAGLYNIELDSLLGASGVVEKKTAKQSKLLNSIALSAGTLSKEEEDELLNYLTYLRGKNKNK